MENSEGPHQLSKVLTPDGSTTLYSAQFGSHYHSKHGAITESICIFIDKAIHPRTEEKKGPLFVFEVGMGMALNAALVWDFALKNQRKIVMVSIEKYPVPNGFLTEKDASILQLNLLACLPDTWYNPDEYFSFKWILGDWTIWEPEKVMFQQMDTLFWDPFAVDDQAEMWTDSSIQKAANLLAPGGRLTTYSAAGWFRRKLEEMGMVVNREAGPPWKRHVTVGIKK